MPIAALGKAVADGCTDRPYIDLGGVVLTGEKRVDPLVCLVGITLGLSAANKCETITLKMKVDHFSTLDSHISTIMINWRNSIWVREPSFCDAA